MNQTTNLIFSFIGGIAVGSLATVGVLKKIAKNNPETVKRIVFSRYDDAPEEVETKHTNRSINSSVQDKPSFELGKTMNTYKVSYSTLAEKPDLVEMAKKYINTTVEKEAAEREHPMEDEIEDDDYDEEAELENEIAESLMQHADLMGIEETDGYGHVLTQLDNGRRDSLIYLIPEEYAGELYPLETLTYYERDDILADVSDTPVDNPNLIIADALEYFGQCGEDPDMVFVRNCGSGFEYEITRVDEYFGAKIYGVSQEEMASVTRKGKSKPRKDEEK